MNEREKVVEKLQKQLVEASLAKRFLDSEEGVYVIDYISEVISTLTNNLIGKRLEHEEYIEARAKIDILRRLKQVLEAKASDTVIAKMSADLELATSED